MQDQCQHIQTTLKANDSGPDEYSQHIEELLSHDKLTMLFFPAEFIAKEDFEHFLRINVAPFKWNLSGPWNVHLCKYPHVVNFTAEHHLFDKLENPFVDVNTVYIYAYILPLPL